LTCIDKKSDGEETIVLDIVNDYEKFRNTLKNNDVIIHLAWDTLEDFNFGCNLTYFYHTSRDFVIQGKKIDLYFYDIRFILYS
jgi:hypothetical protein